MKREICAWILAFFLGMCLILQYHKSVVREAETRASIRLLSQFHYHYIAKHCAGIVDYLSELRTLREKHESLEVITDYTKSVEDSSGANGP